jgi:serine/threonine-protein kinase RsbW
MSSNDINCPTSLSIRYEFVSDPEIVHSILQRATDELGTGNSSANDKANVEIVMAEAINNIIEHAYQFERNQPVDILLTEHCGYLTITFVDEGRPMPFGQIPAENSNDINCSPNNLPEGGFG